MNTEKNTSSESCGCLYMTAAKGIQRFIFSTDKLKDIIGASDLIERLPTEIFTKTLNFLEKTKVFKKDGHDILYAVAGGSAVFFSDLEEAEIVARYWPTLAEFHLPGMEMYQTIVKNCSLPNIFEAIAIGEKNLRTRRNLLYSELPEAGPLVQRSPRTGLPAVDAIENQDVDAGLLRKMAVTREAPECKQLIRKALPEEFHSLINFPECFPRDFSQLAPDDESYLAIVHIDTNGLGAIRMELGRNACSIPEGHNLEKSPIEKLQEFTRQMNELSVGCMRKAVKGILERAEQRQQGSTQQERLYPFRPIICAGDDLTVIMRADDGIAFAEDFLNELQNQGGTELCGFFQDDENPRKLTASAGVVFFKKKYPVARAYELCESLCSYGKEQSLRGQSTITFHRITTSAMDDYVSIIETELSADSRMLTMNPYVIGDEKSNGLVSISALKNLSKEIDSLPQHGFHDVMFEGYNDVDKMLFRFDRLADILPGSAKTSLVEAFRTITKSTEDKCLWRYADNKATQTPLFDALVLNSFAEQGQKA